VKKLLNLLAFFILTLALQGQQLVNVNPDPNGEPWLAGGLRALTLRDYSRIAVTPRLKATAAQKSRNLPSSLDNSTLPWFRPVFNQDGGSCGQASGIGYNFTFEMDFVRNIPANTASTQYPTHFTWNFLNGGEGGGSWYFDGWQIIAADGCPTVQTYGGTPWYGGDRRWMSGYNNYLSGMDNRMLEISTIDVSTVEGLETLKQWMFDRLDGSPSGGLANFSAGVSDVFAMNYLPNGTPNAGKQVITRWGAQVNHAMTFVGYDDNIRFDVNNDGQYTNDLDITGDGVVDLRDWEIGGLVMVNSWGNSFGDAGKAYVMYRTLALTTQEGGIWNNLLHVIRTRTDYAPLLTVKATVKHTSRQKVRISAGISTDLTSVKPDHILDFPLFCNQGGDYYMQGGNTEADKSIEIGLDITPLLSYAVPGEPSRYFLQVTETDPDNSDSGQISSFSVNDIGLSAEFVSEQSNVPLTNNDTTWVWTDAPVNFTPVSIATNALPLAHEGVPYSVQLTAEGAPAPYSWAILQNYTEVTDAAAFPAINSNQLTPNDNDDGFALQTIDFPFPFYGNYYQNLAITTDGSIAFSGQFQYIRSEEDLKGANAITVYGSDLQIYPDQNEGIFYEGDASHATFRWKISRFGNPSFNGDFAVTLYPDGSVVLIYGYGITPSTDWAAGISAGDGQNYLIASVSGSPEIMAGSSLRFTCGQLPEGMSVSSDGVFSGTPQQANSSWPVSFRVTASNHLFSDRTLSFTTGNQLLQQPDTLFFTNDDEAYQGLTFILTNPTLHDVTLTSFQQYGCIELQGGMACWEADFYNQMPSVIPPGESIPVTVAFGIPVLMEPLDGVAADSLVFTTDSEVYREMLMFNDTLTVPIGKAGNEALPLSGLLAVPNPASGFTQVTFSANEAEAVDLTLLNTEGCEVYHETFTCGASGLQTHRLALNSLPAGLYLLNLRMAKQVLSSKLIIQ